MFFHNDNWIESFNQKNHFFRRFTAEQICYTAAFVSIFTKEYFTIADICV